MASGDTLLEFHPYMNEPPGSAGATLDVRNYRPCLDFDAASTERAVFSAVMPQHYSRTTGVTVYLHVAWSTDTNTDHKTRWDVAWELVGDGYLDIDNDDWGSPNSVSQSVVATCGYVDVIAIAFLDGSDMEMIEAGDGFRIYVERDHDHADDDATGDSELYHVELRET